MLLSDFIIKCHNNLVKNTGHEESLALDYITKRNISIETIDKFGIGYCPLGLDLHDSVRFYGQDSIEEKKKWDMSSFIKGRLIIPILSEFNDIVGFATRVPSNKEGNTWWNAPFRKSNHIFILNKSKKEVFEKNKIYLVEGYIDAIILFQNGLKNVGCIMGTCLNSRKIGLIARYCNNVCLCFDADKNEAGQKAQKMAIAILKKIDFCEKISIISGLPVGEDPDVFVSKYGINSFLEKEHILKQNEIKKICKFINKDKEVFHAQ